jgi:hypothetical protein
LFLALLAILVRASTAQSPAPPVQSEREVFLVGAIHRMHFVPKYAYSLQDLAAQVRALRAEVICGEITPDAFDGPMEGYFPVEAAYLAEMASRWNARFIPSDWREDFLRQSSAERELPAETSRRIDEFARKEVDRFEEFRTPSLYDYIHSSQHLDIVDRHFEELIGRDTIADIAMGDWHERNRRIVQNCLADARGARRIVFVFGVSHLPQLMRQLESRGIVAHVSVRRFEPSGLGVMPEQVIARWQRNRGALEGILAGAIAVSADDLSKVRDRVSRIQDLDFALRTYAEDPSPRH